MALKRIRTPHPIQGPRRPLRTRLQPPQLGPAVFHRPASQASLTPLSTHITRAYITCGNHDPLSLRPPLGSDPYAMLPYI